MVNTTLHQPPAALFDQLDAAERAYFETDDPFPAIADDVACEAWFKRQRDRRAEWVAAMQTLCAWARLNRESLCREGA